MRVAWRLLRLFRVVIFTWWQRSFDWKLSVIVAEHYHMRQFVVNVNSAYGAFAIEFLLLIGRPA